MFPYKKPTILTKFLIFGTLSIILLAGWQIHQLAASHINEILVLRILPNANIYTGIYEELILMALVNLMKKIQDNSFYMLSQSSLLMFN